MLGMTPFGMLHTAISLVAVIAGVAALVRYREIRHRYAVPDACTSGSRWPAAMTGLFIFHHGGFGIPHVLSITTLVVLAVAYSAERRASFGRLSRYVAVLGYSLTLFFHTIPGFTETGTRLPVDAPLFTGPEDPALRASGRRLASWCSWSAPAAGLHAFVPAGSLPPQPRGERHDIRPKALITGASPASGPYTRTVLPSLGHDLVLVARDEARLQALAERACAARTALPPKCCARTCCIEPTSCRSKTAFATTPASPCS